MKKSAIKALLATGIIIGLLITVFMQLGASSPTAYNPDDQAMTGVLATDTYTLYPYSAGNLSWGFSKYGELVSHTTGLAYKGLDVFHNPNVLEKDWSNGWYIDIHYADLANNYQHAWAYALYSDLSGGSGIGGDWKEAVTNGPLGTPYGGRKTNVWATTDPITVLYDGPRSFVAYCRTTLYGASDHSVINSGLVNITITFVFNKDKKELVEYKDIKRLDQGKFGRDFQVEFSNRGEWDVGTTSAPPSYAQIYFNQSTVYDYNYQPYYSSTFNANTYDVAQILDQAGAFAGFVAYWPSPFGIEVKPTQVITRSEVLSSLCTIEQNVTWSQISPNAINTTAFNFTAQTWPTTDPYPIGAGVWSNEPMIYKNNVLLYSPGGYTWNSTTQTANLALAPVSTDRFVVDYKHHQPEMAYRPQDYNMGYWKTEPGTPYIIGEWDFKLTTANMSQQFRGVCVYGLTDRHDGSDLDAAAETWYKGAGNLIDNEVKYLLNEVFNPWDLTAAVHKGTTRWVDYTLDPVGTTYWVLNKSPVLYVNNTTWNQYAVFSERVEDLTANGTLLNRFLGDYNLTVVNGIGNITGLNPLHQYKFLYSTNDTGRYEWIAVGRDANSVDSAGAALVSAAFSNTSTAIGNAGLDMEGNTYAYEIPYLLNRFGNGTAFSNYWITPDISVPGQRLALKDDWCTTWAVTSSNIISVGGPLANQVTEYFNSFTDAYYSEPWFTPYTPFAGTIAARSCWSKNTYKNTGTLSGTGYATIETYLDINGTVGLSIYGLDARDTFYASQYFKTSMSTLRALYHGVTSIVLKIGYLDYKHPTFTIVEELGTISEYMLHPDP